MPQRQNIVHGDVGVKRRAGGWVMWGVGLVLGIMALAGIPLGIADYGGLDIRVGLEFMVTAIPAGFLLWGGWKLAHRKPKLVAEATTKEGLK